MYCGNNIAGRECGSRDNAVRIGLEELLNESGVDVIISAHQHSYERTKPLFNYEIKSGFAERAYINPKAPIHIITGAAGNKDGKHRFKPPTPEWSLFRSEVRHPFLDILLIDSLIKSSLLQDYGYTRFKVFNSSHLYFEQVSTEPGREGTVIDLFYIIKDKCAPVTNSLSEFLEKIWFAAPSMHCLLLHLTYILHLQTCR